VVGVLGAEHRRDVEHPVDRLHGPAHRLGAGDVDFHAAHAERLDRPDAGRRPDEGRHVPAFADEALAHSKPSEAGRTRHNRPHACFPSMFDYRPFSKQ
jgi:hypothetical protein